MNKKLLLSALFLSALCPAPAQDRTVVDSLLRTAAASPDDTAKAVLLLDIAGIFMNNLPDSAAHYAQQARRISNLLHFEKGQCRALLTDGFVAYLLGKPEEALLKLDSAYQIARRIGNKNMLAAYYNNVALVYQNQARNLEALENFQKAAGMALEMGKKGHAVTALSNVALVYYDTGNLNEAASVLLECIRLANEANLPEQAKADLYAKYAFPLAELGMIAKSDEYLRKVLAIGTTNQSDFLLMAAYQGLGRNAAMQHRHEMAIAHFEKALPLAEKIGMTTRLCNIQLGLGSSYLESGRHTEAKALFLAAGRLYASAQDCVGLAETKWSLGQLFQTAGQLDSALHYYHRSRESFRQCKDLSGQSRAAGSMADVYVRIKNYALALEFRTEQLALNDSIFRTDMVNRLREQQIRVEFAEERQLDSLQQLHDTRLLQSELKAQRNARNTAVVVAVLVLITALSIYRRARLQRRIATLERSRLQDQITSSTMMALRAQMNPHFLFNSLNSINAFILRKLPAQASAYLTKFADLMRQTLDNAAQDTIPLADEIRFLKAYLEAESLRLENKLTYDIRIADEDLLDLEIPSMILQPYVENAIWHGLSPKPEGGRLTIMVSKEKDMLLFCIEDDGIGRQQARELRRAKSGVHESKGLSITAERLALYDRKQHTYSSVRTIDLFDQQGQAAGTRVEIGIARKQ